MPLLIGLDEAGYGPNLGPLLIATTIWEVPESPAGYDLYSDFAGLVTRPGEQPAGPLVIGDSKQVYASGKGLASLEFPVWHALALTGDSALPVHLPANWEELLRSVHRGPPIDPVREPWYASGLPLPRNAATAPLPALSAWRQVCRDQKIRLRMLAADVVSPQRFNQLNRETGSKGRSLTQLSLQLLAGCLKSLGCEHEQILILADKHGGRNRYQEFLPIVVDDAFITCLEESAASSRYRAGPYEFRFQTKAERHLPTALASLLAKYLRELAMHQFNDWWQAELPGLKPTAGYPVDASRFRREIQSRQAELGIADEVLWRDK
ncbi:MAG: hypothetical protein ACK50P_21350 [Planctomycetaceae bacterium]|jgi:hypothetical protein